MLIVLWRLASLASLIFSIATMYRYFLLRLNLLHSYAYRPKARQIFGAMTRRYINIQGTIALTQLIIGLLYELQIFDAKVSAILAGISWLLMVVSLVVYFVINRKLTFLMRHTGPHEIWKTMEEPSKKEV